VTVAPTVFVERGYRFFFFSREESRMHVHALSSDGEAKFWMEPEIELARKHGLTRAQLRKSSESSRCTEMKSSSRGDDTSRVEVTNISSHGVWLLVHGEELFLAYDQFPWFREAAVRAITNVTEPRTGHLYWPEIDVDLGVEAIRHPERFPLVSRNPCS
jgi:hypothetical protein